MPTVLKSTIVALDGIAVIVNARPQRRDRPDRGADRPDLHRRDRQLVRKLGGADAETVGLVGREGGSGTRTAFESITGAEDACVSLPAS
ncbi:MAG: hypothetical protein ACLUJG_08665 [Lawsonibacter sp.]